MDLNIRDIPEELRQAVRVKAAEQGVTLREFVITVLKQSIDQSPKLDSRRKS